MVHRALTSGMVSISIITGWSSLASPVSKDLTRRGRLAGPSRALFLPGGLLDPSDVPSYLNGTLAGE